MQQLLSVWNALEPKRRLIVGLAAAAMFASVLGLARIAGSPSMALLYSGLEPAAAGEVVAALEQQGIAYQVRGAAIYVDAARRDETRMSLAGQGLPATGAAGYELLDSLSGFGTTAQMFDAAYWRAREGELARTILAWPQVKKARVHIANPVKRPFADPVPQTASVTVTLGAGALTEDRVQALRFLVASAVAGLTPEKVSVIDSRRGLLPLPDSVARGARAQALKRNITRLLAARVGAGNVAVEVTVETLPDSETLVERRIEPDSRVAISTDTSETSGESTDPAAGAVTVASNLPEGDAGAAAPGGRSSSTETRERVNYEVSETTRERVRPAGAIRRIGVAVLVDGLVSTAPDGSTIWQPRPEEELEALRELVESAIGFDASRGDVVTIKSLQFQPLPDQGTVAAASVLDGLAPSVPGLIRTAILSLLALGLGLFVLRPALMRAPVPALPEATPPAQLGAEPAAEAILLGEPEAGSEDGEDPVARLRQIIAERQQDTIEVLQNWIETSEERV